MRETIPGECRSLNFRYRSLSSATSTGIGTNRLATAIATPSEWQRSKRQDQSTGITYSDLARPGSTRFAECSATLVPSECSCADSRGRWSSLVRDRTFQATRWDGSPEVDSGAASSSGQQLCAALAPIHEIRVPKALPHHRYAAPCPSTSS